MFGKKRRLDQDSTNHVPDLRIQRISCFSTVILSSTDYLRYQVTGKALQLRAKQGCFATCAESELISTLQIRMTSDRF